MRGTVDLAAAEGGTVVPIPTRFYYGQGGRYEGISKCGISTTEVPRFGPSRRRCQNFEGTEGAAQEILAEPPEVPPAACTAGGTRASHATLWEPEGGMQRGGSDETAVERLDLSRDVAANRL
jgi:hypothetical protein